MFMTVRKDTQEVSLSGIDQPEGNLIENDNLKIIVVKVPGYNYRYGSTYRETSYRSPCVQVYQVIKETHNDDLLRHLEVDKITEYSTGRKK